MDEGDQAEVAPPEIEKALRIDAERDELLASLSAAQPGTLNQRVAWILNNYPDARNSDITLQLRYWETFCPEDFDGIAIAADDLYKLPRLTSLVRARARIQNTLKLFLADPEVRRQRKTLSEDEREEAAAARSSSAPVYAVYLDESGKTQENLVVGSLWLLQGPESYRLAVKLDRWREASGFRKELHFADLDAESLPHYKAAIDVVLENASALSFKYVTVPRAGTGAVNQTIPKLIYYLVARGVAHEHQSGRAPLPRNLQLWKDAEEVGYDALVLADVGDRLRNAAAGQFGGDLFVDVLAAADSKNNNLLQIADLFAASVNRLINPAPRTGPKHELAIYVVERTGTSLEAAGAEQYEDLAVRVSLAG